MTIFQLEPNRSTNLSGIEKLPLEPIKIVLNLLVKMTGTEGIVNDADTAVILRNIRNLACTSKTMYNTINEPIVVETFLTSLAEKQQKPALLFAAAFDTLGTRRWLWSWICQSKYEETYAIIQDIYDLATSIQEEFRRAGVYFALEERSHLPNALTYRTKTGFGLLYEEKKTLDIVTPFGTLPLYKQGHSSELSLLKVFIQRLDATFAGISYKFSEISYTAAAQRGEYRVVPISHLNGHSITEISSAVGEQITEEQLKTYVGTQSLVISSYLGTKSVYQIRRVKDRFTPEVSVPRKKSKSNLVLISIVWRMLEANRLEGDPVKIKRTRQCVLSSNPQALRTLSEISEEAVDLVRQLALQPSALQPSRFGLKILPQDGETGRFLELLNNATKKFLHPIKHLDIEFWKEGLVLREKNLLYFLLSLVRLDWRTQPCDLETLKTAYDHALSRIGLHWRRSHLKEYPNILLTRSEEDYILFIKQYHEIGFIEPEYNLIRCVAERLGISRYLTVDSTWKKAPLESLPPEPRPLYLWIQKKEFDLVSRLLNLREEPS